MGKDAPRDLTKLKLPFECREQRKEPDVPKKKRSEMSPEELRAAKKEATAKAMAVWSIYTGVDLASEMEKTKAAESEAAKDQEGSNSSSP